MSNSLEAFFAVFGYIADMGTFSGFPDYAKNIPEHCINTIPHKIRNTAVRFKLSQFVRHYTDSPLKTYLFVCQKSSFTFKELKISDRPVSGFSVQVSYQFAIDLKHNFFWHKVFQKNRIFQKNPVFLNTRKPHFCLPAGIFSMENRYQSLFPDT